MVTKTICNAVDKAVDNYFETLDVQSVAFRLFFAGELHRCDLPGDTGAQPGDRKSP